MRCTFQAVDATELASRQEINTELLIFAVIVHSRNEVRCCNPIRFQTQANNLFKSPDNHNPFSPQRT